MTLETENNATFAVETENKSYTVDIEQKKQNKPTAAFRHS